MRNDARANLGEHMLTIRQRIEAARQLDFVSVQDFSLLTGISERTVWRRIRDGLFPHVLKNQGITRIHRQSAMKALRPTQQDQA